MQNAIGKDPFKKSPATPGALGVNDSAAPDSPTWLKGKTLGPLGYNDGAYAHLTSTTRTICGTDIIDQLISMLDSVIDFNIVTFGTKFEPSDAGVEDPSSKSEKEMISKTGRQGRSIDKLYASLPKSSKIKSSLSNRLISATPVRGAPRYGSTANSDGIASLMESLSSIAKRNSAASQLANVLRDQASSIRRLVPLDGGGVLVQINIYVQVADGDDIQIGGVNVLGAGPTPLGVFMDFVGEEPSWRSAPNNPNPLLESIYREPAKWQNESFYLWVTEPCINFEINFRK